MDIENAIIIDHNNMIQECEYQINQLNDGYIFYEICGGCNTLENKNILNIFNGLILPSQFREYIKDIDLCDEYKDIPVNDLFDYFEPLFFAIYKYKSFCNEYNLKPTFEPIPLE